MTRHRRIGDLIELQRRWIEVDPLETYQEIGVRSFGRGIFHKEPVTGDILGKKRVLWIEPGDLVFNNVFAWEGAIGLASEAERGTSGSHRFMTYVPKSDGVDVHYLYYFFRCEEGVRLLERASPGSAGRNRTLAIDRFEALEIPLPPIDEQQRIVEDIERWAGWEADLRRAAPAESVAMHAIPGVIDGILRRCAEEEMKVGELVEFVNDLVRPGDDPAPATTFVGLQHVESHTGRRTGELQLGQEKGRKFRFAPGDIVYGYLRPYLNKAWVADLHGLCSVDQYVLRPMTDVPAEFVAFALRSRSTLDEANRLTHSLQLPRLRSGLLLGVTIPVPAREKVAEVVSRLTSATDRVVELDQVTKRRDRLIDALSPSVLNRAFAGLA